MGPASDSAALQTLVDALSVALHRPVLLDDEALHPLAYSRQSGAIDDVRRDSILQRGASPQVRSALLEQGIARATDVVATAPVPRLGMEARVCLPVRAGGEPLGYLWLLAARDELQPAELDGLHEAARRIGELLARGEPPRLHDESALIARLGSADDDERAAAAADVRERALLPDGPLVVCLASGLEGDADLDLAAARIARRLSPGHVLHGRGLEQVVLLIATGDPVLRLVGAGETAQWLFDASEQAVALGLSDPVAGPDEIARGRHEAAIALRAARRRPPQEAHATWAQLGADRLLLQLPPASAADLPAPLLRLLREEPELARTLAVFLDHAGDVKATAAALSLHRSGLYYRLRRVEELTGLDLERGEDRLLAQLAVRFAPPL